jgi:nucleoside-diphosphate-sugar epimerase
MAELEVWRGQEEGLNVVVVNPAVIIGPGEWGSSSTSVFTTVYKGLKFYSKGSNAFVDVRDVTKAMLELSDKKIYNERFLLFSENMSFKRFMELIADALGKKPPSIQSTRWMTSLAWRANWLFSLLSGKRPVITRETARAANAKQVYSHQKIKDAIGIEFISVNKALERTASLFLEELKG